MRRTWFAVRDIVVTLLALATYSVSVVPCVRAELSAWRARANAIPDAVLRRHALETLTAKALNAEAVAVFAILVPFRARRPAIVLLVAYQVLTDYLDTVSEQPAGDVLRNGIQLHRALIDVLRSDEPRTDYYRHHRRHDDGGYVDDLVSVCRERFRALPSGPAVRAVALEAARRCGEGQSHTHAALARGPGVLASWATREARGRGYEWWEVAAGASSSVAIHALLAAAADPRTSAVDAALVDAAYFPSLGALTVLLDNLVDQADDAEAGSHNYLGYYRSNLAAARRLSRIQLDAAAGMRALRHPARHAAIATGVTGFYLSAPEADSPYASPIKQQMVANAGPALGPILILMRARRGRRPPPQPGAIAPPSP